MQNYSIRLRNFEEKDVDFVYKCKNDPILNNLIVGNYRHFTREDAEKWVKGCIVPNTSYKFWVICTNDVEQKIVGWVSLSDINIENNSVCHHGIVIGDNDYRDGVAMFEAMLLSMDYAFNTLKTHRLYGSCISEHKISPYMLSALGFILEGQRRDAIYKNNRYYDILDYGLLSNEYLTFNDSGRYKIDNLICSFIKNVKNKSKNGTK